MSEKITVDFKVNSTFSTEIDSDEVIESLNNLPLKRRWGIVARILNQIQLDENHELEPQQRKVILSWLEYKIDKLKEMITILDETK
jgi:hypothetical protein